MRFWSLSDDFDCSEKEEGVNEKEYFLDCLPHYFEEEDTPCSFNSVPSFLLFPSEVRFRNTVVLKD